MRKKNIVIAGAGPGMGNHIAEVFGRHGFQVFLLARNRKHLTEYEEQFRGKGIDCFGIVTDIADIESVKKAFANIFRKTNYIDVLVCNVILVRFFYRWWFLHTSNGRICLCIHKQSCT